jgi:hypothetical protein
MRVRHGIELCDFLPSHSRAGERVGLGDDLRQRIAFFDRECLPVKQGILSILVDGHPFGLRSYAADSSTSSPSLKTRPSRTSSSCCQRVIFRHPLRASMMSRWVIAKVAFRVPSPFVL